MSATEETHLLSGYDNRRSDSQGLLSSHRRHGCLTHQDVGGHTAHAQFCALTGCPPSSDKNRDGVAIPSKSLYGRTTSHLTSQRRAYNVSATVNNGLLLSQVILGAALTGLGASASSHILITIFGAMNTIIAGLVAYLKSRGQPMRARMYRDDLERVVDEIENSEIMWRGISEGVHGYDDIDTDEVTVRSEVARLTRLYERAVRLNGMNNPDMYMAGGVDGSSGGSGRPPGGGQQQQQQQPQQQQVPPGQAQNALQNVTSPSAPQPSGQNDGPSVPLVQNSDDLAPATRTDVPLNDDKKKDKDKDSDDDEHKSSKHDASDHDDNDDKASHKAPPSVNNKAAASNGTDSKPGPSASGAKSPPPQIAQIAGVLPLNDPDASPATAARLKPKRTRSDKSREGGEGGSKKISGDSDE